MAWDALQWRPAVILTQIINRFAVQRLKSVTLAMLAFSAVMALYLAASMPLSPDEAHYALYGSHLDWSYFDHPPMVGWVQGFFLLLGEHEFILRLAPLLTGLATGWLLFRLTRQFFSESAAWLAVLLYLATPMLRLLGVAWVPESPLMLVGMGCLYFTLHIQQGPLQRASMLHWLGLGLCLGLAALSKYTAVTLALSVALALLYRFGWAVLLAKGLWLAVLVAALLLLPVLGWNYQHDWISFLYQLNHGAGDSEWTGFKALQMQAGQLASYGLLIYVLGIVASVWALAKPERRYRFMTYMLFAWPILILFSVLAAKGRSLPHWTAMGVLFLLPVMAHWLVQLFAGRFASNLKLGVWHCVWIGLLALVNLILLIGAYLVLAGVNLGYKDYQHPLQDLVGWREVAQETRDLALADETAFQQLFVPNWSHGSRYAWYARPLPVKILDTRVDQFDLWFGQAQQGDSGYLVLHREKDRYHDVLLGLFEQCQLVKEQGARLGELNVNHFKIYRCSGYGAVADASELKN